MTSPDSSRKKLDSENFPEDRIDGEPVKEHAMEVCSDIRELVHEKAQTAATEPEAKEADICDAVIYVVDDEPMILRPMKRILHNYRNVQTFGDGEEVLAAIFNGANGEARDIPDLVISDTNMKHVSGKELFRKLLEIEPLRRPQFMAMSGAFETGKNGGAVQLFKEHGIIMISKPFDIVPLKQTVESLLRRHHRFARPSNK